jgi:hypothetical protein
MNPQDTDLHAGLRRSLYAILIALAVGGALGRILAVTSVDRLGQEKARIQTALAEIRQRLEAEGLEGVELQERLDQSEAELQQILRLQRPFLSSNDRSRWAAARALVEHGTFAIDQIVAEPGWDTIDIVQHKDASGEPRLYSSKPPLLSVLLAGEYWLVHRATGATLATHPFAVGRFMVITINVTCLLVMLAIVASLAERFGRTDWGRVFVVASAALGTFLTTFVVVLNNHTIAATSTATAVFALARIWCDGDVRLRNFALCGLATAFTVACELPALAFLAAAAAGLVWRYPRPTLLAFLPAAAVVFIASVGTNYLAHGTVYPPYAFRSDTNPDDNWYEFTYVRDGRELQSYWSDPTGIDRGEPSRGRYAFHVLIGHHGVFSLTPIWILSVVGATMWLAGSRRDLREIALLVASTSFVCVVFYLLRDQRDRNYGGMTSCFRWLLWFAPMWLLVMLPAADWMSRSKVARAVALVLLAVSVLSASYPTWNPWTYPWLTDFFLSHGWEKFH